MSATQSEAANPNWNPDAAPDDNYKWKAFGAIGISFVTMVMSFSIVFVALSAIADDYGVTLRAVSWVVVAQSLTISAVMMPMGRVADIIGRKRIHLIGLVLFGGGAIFAAVSPTLPILLVARVIMAAGNSMGQSVGTAMIVSVFPSNERGKAIGSQTTAVAIGGASGPIIAGLLLQVLPWQALFILMAIPTALAFVLGLLILDENRVSQRIAGERPPYDWIGAILSAAAITMMVITINNPFAADWFSLVIIGGATAMAALFAGFIVWELRIKAPMLDLRMFKDGIFRLAVATRYIGFMGTTATLFMMPIFLISFRGLETSTAGGILFLNMVGMGISAQVSGRLSDVFGSRRFVLVGFGFIFITSIGFSMMTADTPLWIISAVLFVNGVGMGLWNVPNNSVILGAVPRSRYGVVSALTNLTRNVGNVTGQAFTAAVVVGVMASNGFDIPLSEIVGTEGAGDAFLRGWQIAYWAVAAFTVAGALLAFMTRPPSDGSEEIADTADPIPSGR